MKNLLITMFCLYNLLSTAHAYLGVNESAEIIPNGHYRVGVIPEFFLGSNPSDYYTGKDGGSDYSAFLDMNVQRDINARFVLGTGTTDFWAGAFAKWVPYPDYENQPAIGVRGGFMFVREQSSNFYDLQVTPIISKKYETQAGALLPYVGVPLTLVYEKSSHNFTAVQMAVGSDWEFQKDSQLGAELDMDLKNTTTTISLHLNLEFDETKGFKK